MNFNENTILRKNPDISTRNYLKSTIIEPGITLNEVATNLFERIDGIRTLAEICKDMVKEYEVDYQTILGDSVELVQGLIEKNIILVE
ncbi:MULTISPECIES: PqqD family protein [Paenibacillus]|uniref:AslA n=1 Tax=Paenibacillus polymyxa (strain SC2) TaxID=886882 RepID=E3EC80_PAEPS|nr:MULTISPECIES: PqqD family protein [Paenibacillus]KAF6627792.1 PqqD family protein [Paenibacillus sp. EKM208P]ADO54223.1 aslA [Paenibacillus polymyxa SC2]MCP3780910.1 PqqD family protein [Paenibacillus sp. MZ03-122A]WPQ57146.1 PqqD family protein [Paenibacillus polymyxa]CCC83153.1 uncharacterized protein yxbA [Paenibacillus polymyxa M1]